MAIIFFIVTAIVQTHPAPSTSESGSSPVSASGKATVAMIYLFVIVYNMTWGPLPWPYISEIFTARIREPGVAVGVASQWLFNFLYTLVTPYMVENLAWGTFLFWGMANLVIAMFSWFCIKETRGRSLESINAEIGGQGLFVAKAQREDESREQA